MKKKYRIIIKLISSSNSKHYYTSFKNKKNNKNNIKIKKFDPIKRKHYIYTESKIK